MRRIFLRPRDRYSFHEAAILLSITKRKLEYAAELGEIDSIEAEGRRFLTWSQVVTLALEKWSVRTIFEELGTKDARKALPPALHPKELTVVLPSYQVSMLAVLARHQHMDVERFIEAHLLDLASVEGMELADAIPGLTEGLNFPGGEA